MKQVEDAYNGETIVNSEQKYNFQYHSLSSIGKSQNVFQQGPDIVRKSILTDKMRQFFYFIFGCCITPFIHKILLMSCTAVYFTHFT